MATRPTSSKVSAPDGGQSASASGNPAHSAEETSSAAPSTAKGVGLGERALTWRSIGPFRGGRAVAVAGDPTHPYTFYFGSTGGGVWKTTDGGRYWQNVSDGFFK